MHIGGLSLASSQPLSCFLDEDILAAFQKPVFPSNVAYNLNEYAARPLDFSSVTAICDFAHRKWGAVDGGDGSLILWHHEKEPHQHSQQIKVSYHKKEILVASLQLGNGPLISHPLDELLLVYLLALEHEGLMLHSLAVRYKDGAYLFAGPSGMGKSTLGRAFHSLFLAERVDGNVLNDEKNVVLKHGYLSGASWAGNPQYRKNGTFPLKGIYLLQQGTRPEMKCVSGKDMLVKMFQCLYAPYGWQPGIEFALDFLVAISKKIPCLQFQFTDDIRSAEYFVDSIKNEY